MNTTSQPGGAQPFMLQHTLQNFPAAAPWSSYPRHTFADLMSRFSDALPTSPYVKDMDRLLAYWGHRECLLVSGSIHVSSAQMTELETLHLALVVDGSIQVDGALRNVLYVRGDITCDTAEICSPQPPLGSDLYAYTPGTRIVASHYVSLLGADDECMKDTPNLQIDTPYLFSWFHRIHQLNFGADTIVFILADDDYCDGLTLPNIVLAWHSSLYALQPQHTWAIMDAGSDEMFWNFESISQALSNGENLFIEGFDPSCMHDQKNAVTAHNAKDYRNAYLHFQASAAKSPMFYPACLGMGQNLFSVAAFEQALACYRRASACFPIHQIRLINEGLSMGALAAIRLERYPLALQMSDQCIVANQSQRGRYSLNVELAFAHRVRAEAHLMLGERAKAQADLVMSLELNPGHGSASWLMGLVHAQQGELTLAQTFLNTAAKRNSKFGLYYVYTRPHVRTVAANTNALEPHPIRVDWDLPGQAIGTVKDEAYWCQYLRYNEPKMIRAVPMAMRTPQVCMVALKETWEVPRTRVPWASLIPLSSFTPELADRLVQTGGSNLKYLPKTMITKERCMLARPEAGEFDASVIPADLFDEELARHAIDCGAALADVPPQWRNLIASHNTGDGKSA